MASLNNDIERYMRGELSPAEMHDLEKKALRDPFLAEALEGAEYAGADTFSLDLQLLQQSIRSKTKKRKKPRLISLNNWGLYMGIAAGLLLLTVSYFIIWSIIAQQRVDQTASTKPADPVPSPTLADSTATAAITTSHDSLISFNGNAATKPAQEEKPDRAKKITEKEHRFSVAIAKEEDESKQRILADVTRGDVARTEPITAEAPADLVIGSDDEAHPVEEKVAESRLAKKSQEAVKDKETDKSKALDGYIAGTNVVHRAELATTKKIVKGKVTSAEDGLPLTGVNVLVKGTSVGTVTDIEGNYELTVVDPARPLVFSFIGLTSKEVKIENKEEVNIELNADVTQLSELVVVSDVSKSDADETRNLAEPEGGRNAYKQYLEEKLHYPQQAIANEVEGKVTVQFTVEANGQLSDFKILKGLGYGCDDEVIRLIKQGPAWSPTKRNNAPVKDKVRLRLKFDLPKKK